MRPERGRAFRYMRLIARTMTRGACLVGRLTRRVVVAARELGDEHVALLDDTRGEHMLAEHLGKRPVVDPEAVIAPTAVISGDVHIGSGSVVLTGAVITSQGAPVRIGQHCIVMENAVLRGAGRYPCTLGNHVLIGPHAHIAGATVNGCAFVATGASVFNGAVLEQGVVVAINAIVHVGTRCVAGTGVPIGHIALGDPATIYPPHEAPTVHAQLRALGFTKAVFGLEAQSLADAGTIEKVCERYARSLRAHRDDAILAE